jgi:dimethylamine monooxygenase subunit A
MPFDFDAISTPFRMQPGLRRVKPGAPQLTPNRIGDAALHEKLGVLSRYAEQALMHTPGFDPAPAVQALFHEAANDASQAFAIAQGNVHTARHLGWSLHSSEPVGDGPAEIGACLRALPPPWRLPALLCLAFAEDFAVIDGATSHIPWLAVCLPSHWSPADKVGRHFAEVHAPVADNQVLITASDHLARLVTGSDRWERFVWTITPRSTLDNHPQRCGTTVWKADSEPFFRTEHQTFIPVPDQRQAVFTIHVEVRPLAQAIGTPAQAQRLHDALASMSPAVLDYRGLRIPRERLLAWLAQAASTAGA